MLEALQNLLDLGALQLALLAVGLFLSGLVPMVAGVGGALVMLVTLGFFFPIQRAVPMLAVIMFCTHGVRVFVWRRQVKWSIVWRFIPGTLIGALLGSLLFAKMPAHVIAKAVGVFLISFSIWSVIAPRFTMPVKLNWFIPVGAAAGFVSAVVGGGGPVTGVFLLSFGLFGPVYAATAIATQLASHTVKMAGYGWAGALSLHDIYLGFILSVVVLPSIFTSKWAAERLNPKVLRAIVLLVLFSVGVRFLLK